MWRAMPSFHSFAFGAVMRKILSLVSHSKSAVFLFEVIYSSERQFGWKPVRNSPKAYTNVLSFIASVRIMSTCFVYRTCRDFEVRMANDIDGVINAVREKNEFIQNQLKALILYVYKTGKCEWLSISLFIKLFFGNIQKLEPEPVYFVLF